jgi:hypothetical protein
MADFSIRNTAELDGECGRGGVVRAGGGAEGGSKLVHGVDYVPDSFESEEHGTGSTTTPPTASAAASCAPAAERKERAACGG